MRITTLLCSTALVALSAANANAATGWYLGVEAGWNTVSDNDIKFSTTFGFTTPLNVDFDDGWAILATIGYNFGGHWRVEGELGYRNNDISGIRITGTRPRPTPLSATSFTPGGSLEEVSLMANVLYDIYLGSRFKLTLGAGIGGDYASFDVDGGLGDNNWSFAYQGIIGLAYALSPRTDLTLNYRYLVAEGADFGGLDPTFGFFNERFSSDDFHKQSITIGFRYDLQPDVVPLPPAPPPPPPPEPPKARQFLVFFGFNKSNLTAEAERVITEAAAAAKEYGSASIVVVGHADTVGSPAYNMRLSERRANVVRGSLVSHGIAEGQITASGRGETELMVQTGDNVKEPQNRRATIDING